MNDKNIVGDTQMSRITDIGSKLFEYEKKLANMSFEEKIKIISQLYEHSNRVFDVLKRSKKILEQNINSYFLKQIRKHIENNYYPDGREKPCSDTNNKDFQILELMINDSCRLAYRKIIVNLDVIEGRREEDSNYQGKFGIWSRSG